MQKEASEGAQLRMHSELEVRTRADVIVPARAFFKEPGCSASRISRCGELEVRKAALHGECHHMGTVIR